MYKSLLFAIRFVFIIIAKSVDLGFKMNVTFCKYTIDDMCIECHRIVRS